MGRYEVNAEEYRASNEELQALNEELRSASEELETSREELQSINEELITVNMELKARVEEVGQGKPSRRRCTRPNRRAAKRRRPTVPRTTS